MPDPSSKRTHRMPDPSSKRMLPMRVLRSKRKRKMQENKKTLTTSRDLFRTMDRKRRRRPTMQPHQLKEIMMKEHWAQKLLRKHLILRALFRDTGLRSINEPRHWLVRPLKMMKRATKMICSLIYHNNNNLECHSKWMTTLMTSSNLRQLILNKRANRHKLKIKINLQMTWYRCDDVRLIIKRSNHGSDQKSKMSKTKKTTSTF